VQVNAVRLSEHVLQVAVPTPTLPPSYETNTYVIHHGSTALLVDAGSEDEAVLQELVDTLKAEGIERVTTLLATHYHRDHTQGLPFLQRAYHAPIHVHRLDQPAVIQQIGFNWDVKPIQSTYDVNGLTVHVDHHPGHTHGHVHIRIPADKVVLVGDHMAGDGSVWIGPPDGHMAPYFDALRAIEHSGCEIAGPGHGKALPNPAEAATALLKRRQQREQEIVQLIAQAPRTLQELVSLLYDGIVPDAALWVARKTVQAHLQHLLSGGAITRKYAAATGQFVYTRSPLSSPTGTV
jgi:endoribonuclease LACTB2